MSLEVCPRCGKKEDTESVYYPYVHYRVDYPGRRVPCVELEDWAKRRIDELSEFLGKRLAETLDKILKESE